MWIFEIPDNYGKMIEKISKSVFVISLLLLYLISCINTEFKLFLDKISFGATYELFGLKLNLALFYLPIAMGIFEHAFKVHDKVSWLFGIRRNYDKHIIISRYYKKLGIPVKIEEFNKEKIEKLMSKTFYKYASSTDPKIDKHSITLTLNEWCWFWIALDTGLLLCVIGVLYLIYNWCWFNLFKLAICGLVFLAFLGLILVQTIYYSWQEIDAILSEEEYAMDVKKVLENALSNK